MPDYYWYHCNKCGYRAERYRNVKVCPQCGGELVRETAENVIRIHAVIIDGEGTNLEMHTHGLKEYSHPEFLVIADSLFYDSAGRLLNSLSDAVINGEVFKDGEICDWGEWGMFKLEKNIDSGTNIVLRITSIPPVCEICEGEESVG